MKLLLLVLLVGAVCSKPLQFSGEQFINHHLIDVNITLPEHAQYLNNLADVGNMGLDIWLQPTIVKTGRLRVPPESVTMFMDLMTKSGISAQIRHSNLHQLNADILSRSARVESYNDFSGGLLSHTAYYSMAQIDSFLGDIASTYSSSGVTRTYLARLTAAGNRQTPMISITGGSGSNKKRVFIEAGVHAREWISPASSLYFMDRLLALKDSDSVASTLFNNYDWYIVPVSNPDGYEYSRDSYRYWRKNRRAVSGCGSNRGVDLNRNFDSMWGGSGSSGSCSSDTFRGPSVFSENESMNIRDAVQSIKANQGTIHAYFSIHSFSQLLLTPYGYAANTYPPNYSTILSATNKGRDAISAYSGLSYTVGTPANILYNADGGSHDWARLTEGIQYAMTYELRPSSGGLNGFVLPTEQIVPNSREVFESIYAIVQDL